MPVPTTSAAADAGSRQIGCVHRRVHHCLKLQLLDLLVVDAGAVRSGTFNLAGWHSGSATEEPHRAVAKTREGPAPRAAEDSLDSFVEIRAGCPVDLQSGPADDRGGLFPQYGWRLARPLPVSSSGRAELERQWRRGHLRAVAGDSHDIRASPRGRSCRA